MSHCNVNTFRQRTKLEGNGSFFLSTNVQSRIIQYNRIALPFSVLNFIYSCSPKGGGRPGYALSRGAKTVKVATF